MSFAEVILNSIPILVDKLERLLLNFDKREIWLTNKLNIVIKRTNYCELRLKKLLSIYKKDGKVPSCHF